MNPLLVLNITNIFYHSVLFLLILSIVFVAFNRNPSFLCNKVLQFVSRFVLLFLKVFPSLLLQVTKTFTYIFFFYCIFLLLYFDISCFGLESTSACGIRDSV